jgi:hypothetical protein
VRGDPAGTGSSRTGLGPSRGRPSTQPQHPVVVPSRPPADGVGSGTGGLRRRPGPGGGRNSRAGNGAPTGEFMIANDGDHPSEKYLSAARGPRRTTRTDHPAADSCRPSSRTGAAPPRGPAGARAAGVRRPRRCRRPGSSDFQSPHTPPPRRTRARTCVPSSAHVCQRFDAGERATFALWRPSLLAITPAEKYLSAATRTLTCDSHRSPSCRLVPAVGAHARSSSTRTGRCSLSESAAASAM